MPKMRKIIANSEKLLAKVKESEEVVNVLNELSTLLVFNLVDMVKIAIEEGTYHKS